METTINLEELVRRELSKRLKDIEGDIRWTQNEQNFLTIRYEEHGSEVDAERLRRYETKLHNLLREEREIRRVLDADISVNLTEKNRDGYAAAHRV